MEGIIVATPRTSMIAMVAINASNVSACLRTFGPRNEPIFLMDFSSMFVAQMPVRPRGALAADG